MRTKYRSLEQLVQQNKQELLQDKERVAQIEMYIENKIMQRGLSEAK